MIIKLPYPDSRLNPNKRLHWAKVAKVKKLARNIGWSFTKETIKRKTFTAPLSVSITFYPPDKRKRDDDNAIAAFKAYRDGIADALGVDDADWVTSYHFHKTAPLGKVVVEVTQ